MPKNSFKSTVDEAATAQDKIPGKEHQLERLRGSTYMVSDNEEEEEEIVREVAGVGGKQISRKSTDTIQPTAASTTGVWLSGPRQSSNTTLNGQVVGGIHQDLNQFTKSAQSKTVLPGANHVLNGQMISNINVEGSGRLIVGNYYGSTGTSLFESLVHTQDPAIGQATCEILKRRDVFQNGRKPRSIEQPAAYTPYAVVTNQKIRRRLLRIAHRFQFLDRGFAEYFQTVAPSFGHEHVQHLLADARKRIAVSQRRDPSQNNIDDVYLGALGHYCEMVAQQWDHDLDQQPKYDITHGRNEDILHYLQDALEVPYWDIMANLFSRWNINSKTLSGEVVLRVLSSVTIDIQEGKSRLLEEMQSLTQNEKDSITPILEGIEMRLDILRDLGDASTSNPEVEDRLSAIFERPLTATSPPEKEVTQTEAQQHKQNASNVILLIHNTSLTATSQESAILVALSLLFLTAAIVPGYKGYAISMSENSVGSTADADFWYLIQSNIMAVLGSLVMIIPLFRSSWFSPAYSLMWTFFTLGLIASVISVVVYPLLNTGWSSLIAFLGSIMSASSVLVMTQASARVLVVEKAKQD